MVRVQRQGLFQAVARRRRVALADVGGCQQVVDHRVARLLDLQPLRRCQRAVEGTRPQVGQRQHEVGARALCVERRCLLQLGQAAGGVAARHLAHAQCHQVAGGGRRCGGRPRHQCAGLGVVAGLHVGLAGQRQPGWIDLSLLQQRRQRFKRQRGLVDAQHRSGIGTAHDRVFRVGLQQLLQSGLGLLHKTSLQLGLGQQAHRRHVGRRRGHRQLRCFAGRRKLPLTEVQHGLRVVDQRMFRRHLAQRVELSLGIAELVVVDLQPCHGQARHDAAGCELDGLLQRLNGLLGLGVGLCDVGPCQPHVQRLRSRGKGAVGQRRRSGHVPGQQGQLRLAQQRAHAGRRRQARGAERSRRVLLAPQRQLGLAARSEQLGRDLGAFGA